MKLGTTELMIILAIVVLLFGPSQIPKLTRMFKKSSQNFKAGMDEAAAEGDALKTQAQTVTTDAVAQAQAAADAAARQAQEAAAAAAKAAQDAAELAAKQAENKL